MLSSDLRTSGIVAIEGPNSHSCPVPGEYSMQFRQDRLEPTFSLIAW